MHEKFTRRYEFNFWIIIVEFNFRLDTYFYHCVILNIDEPCFIQLVIGYHFKSLSKLTETILEIVNSRC